MFEGIAWAMGPAQPGAGQQGGAGSMLTSFLPLVIIFVIFYFLLIRPQQKRAKDHKQMLANIKKGDKVTTSGGIHGVVEEVREMSLIVDIATKGSPAMKVKLDKGHIAHVRSSGDED